MPFKRSYRKKTTRKKYGKKYGRKRFSKKKFNKNSTNFLNQRATLAARSLFIKLPWVKTFVENISASGTEIFAFQGNSILPYTAAGQSGAQAPAAGDYLPAGAAEYSNFYDQYVIYGSSITVEAINTSVTTSAVNAVLRAVLLAVPVSQSSNDDWDSTKTQLDAYTYEQLLSWPFAKWRMIASGNGGNNRLKFKMFRKTKSMSGIKDVRDNQVLFGGSLPDGILATGGSTAIIPTCGFMYYLRFYNLSSATAFDIDITVRMKLYVCMTSREFNTILTLTS